MQVSRSLRRPGPRVVLLVGLALADAARASPPPLPAQRLALDGIRAAAGRGQLDPATAGKDRTLVNRAVALIRDLPKQRAALIAAQLQQVAALARRFSTPRALTLFGQLQANEQWLAQRAPPPDGTDVTGADGVVYRYFVDRGFEFHPLANASALDNAAAARDTTATQALAQALVARAITQPNGGLAWEYEFPYDGGRPPWLSGMAQAVFAQAFARASVLLGDAELMAEARAAFRAIPGRLVRSLPAGPWIRLYSFNRSVVLNAQLQSIVSLSEYAGASDDAAAGALADALERTALAELPRFDTGYWSYYALPNTFSPPSYQSYVVTLLQKLAPRDPAFGAAAARFQLYSAQQPAFKLANAGAGALEFWLSKPASVVVTAVGPAKRLSLAPGWHVLRWKLPKRAGIYPVHVTATDWAGNSASFDGLPLVRVATAAPSVTHALRAAQPSPGQSGFTVGARLDDPTQAPLARRLQLGAVQLGVPWQPGQTVPDATVVSALAALAARGRLVVELLPDALPADDAGRSALAAFVTALVQQVGGIHDLLLGPAPAVADAAVYVAALAAVDDAAKAAAPAVAVGGELDGGAAPQSTLNALARAYQASGRITAVMDELALRPAPAPASGAWTVDDYPKASAAVARAFGALPILYDAAEAAPGLAAAAQADAYTHLLESACCQPKVTGVVFGRLVDAAGDASGFFAADGTAKASVATLAPLIASAQRGELTICPGLSSSADTTALVFPTDPGAGVQLGCVRDCLYLLTLERAGSGTPVLAARGALRGGAAPTTIHLPALPVPAGAYVLDVRLVSRTNPGPVRLLQSPPLTVG